MSKAFSIQVKISIHDWTHGWPVHNEYLLDKTMVVYRLVSIRAHINWDLYLTYLDHNLN